MNRNSLPGKTKEDRRHDMRMLLLGFLLTTVAGGLITWLAQYIQEGQRIEAEKRLEEVKIMEQRREQATLLFNELSPLMDTRLYDWRRLAWGLEDRILEDSINSRYFAYMAVFFKWNQSLNRNRALVCRFFGSDLGGTFEDTIMADFRRLHNSILSIYRLPRNSRPLFKSDSLNSMADSLNDVIYQFNNSMAEAIRSGNVGLIDPGNSCSLIKSNE